MDLFYQGYYADCYLQINDYYELFHYKILTLKCPSSHSLKPVEYRTIEDKEKDYSIKIDNNVDQIPLYIINFPLSIHKQEENNKEKRNLERNKEFFTVFKKLIYYGIESLNFLDRFENFFELYQLLNFLGYNLESFEIPIKLKRGQSRSLIKNDNERRRTITNPLQIWCQNFYSSLFFRINSDNKFITLIIDHITEDGCFYNNLDYEDKKFNIDHNPTLNDDVKNNLLKTINEYLYSITGLKEIKISKVNLIYSSPEIITLILDDIEFNLNDLLIKRQYQNYEPNSYFVNYDLSLLIFKLALKMTDEISIS